MFTDGSVMWRMENNKIAKRVYVGERAGSHSVVRSRKRWIDTMKQCWMSGKENGPR